MEIQESVSIIHNLYEKYQDHPYMLQRLNTYIRNMPSTMESLLENYKQRSIRNEEMVTNQEIFLENFFNRFKNYYYNTSSEKFFYYDDKNYSIISEDDILHHILRSITECGTLTSWKQKTKRLVMVKIKENNILKTIPNSDTIQQVLDLLYPAVFQTKHEAKYFLTMLGDGLRKKHQNLFHIVSHRLIKFIRELNNFAQMYFVCHCTQTIKYKYHEHDYNLCRVLHTNEVGSNILNPILEQALNILCVASHYSTRYDSSDQYLERMNNDAVRSQILFLKTTTPDEIITKFLDEYIQVNTSGNTMEDASNSEPVLWKNIIYLWRHFLESLKLPCVVFIQVVKQKLQTRLSEYYDEASDSFKNISSKYLPRIKNFIIFWNETMEYDEMESDLEIEEIMILYKKWLNVQSTQMTEKQVFDILQYYFPEVETELEKFVNKIKCKLWDKNLEIQICLENIKELFAARYNSQFYSQTTLCVYEIYQKYCKIQYSLNKMIASKIYFEKYVHENLTQFLLPNNTISMEWVRSPNTIA